MQLQYRQNGPNLIKFVSLIESINQINPFISVAYIEENKTHLYLGVIGCISTDMVEVSFTHRPHHSLVSSLGRDDGLRGPVRGMWCRNEWLPASPKLLYHTNTSFFSLPFLLTQHVETNKMSISDISNSKPTHYST